MDVSGILLAILLGIISNALYAVIATTLIKLPSSLSRRDPRRASRSVTFLIILWPLLNLVYFLIVYIFGKPVHWFVPLPISFITFAVLFYFQLSQFWRLGIRGIDTTIKDGINYDRALKLCRNGLKFLGIGASKLTKEPEFEKALERCATNKPIKLLLLVPDDPRLIESAKRFDRPIDEYRKNVQESLRKIANLKERRDFNIEVRFYSMQPVFRLMFIDDSLCLTSYYELGKGDGSQLPQIHIVKAREDQPMAKSVFHPLEIYFDELWKISKQWDFKQYLT